MSKQGLSIMASDLLAAVLPANQMPGFIFLLNDMDFNMVISL